MKRNTQPPNVRAQSGSSDYALQRGGGVKVNLRFVEGCREEYPGTVSESDT